MDLKELKKLINEEVNRRKSFQEQEEPPATGQHDPSEWNTSILPGIAGQPNQALKDPSEDPTKLNIYKSNPRGPANADTVVRGAPQGRDASGNRPKTPQQARLKIISFINSLKQEDQKEIDPLKKDLERALQEIDKRNPGFADARKTPGKMEYNFINLIKKFDIFERGHLTDEEMRQAFLELKEKNQLPMNISTVLPNISNKEDKSFFSEIIAGLLSSYETIMRKPEPPESRQSPNQPGYDQGKINADFNKKLGLPATGVNTPTVAPPKRLKQESKIKIRVS